MKLHKSYMQNLSDHTSDLPIEDRFLAEIADAFHDWIDTDEENQETWGETTIMASLFGPKSSFADVILDTDNHSLAYILDNGRLFQITCQEVK